MRPVIVQQAGGVYVRRMREALAKLLLMLAVLAMPFVMAAPAAAATPHHPAHAAAAMPMQHCPEQGRTSHAMGSECTMACAATLPAVGGTSTEEHFALVAAPAPRTLAEPLLGLHPETATPPPRFS